MTSKRYLERLKNIKMIVDAGNEILDLEIEMDTLRNEKVKISNETTQGSLRIDKIQKKDLNNQKLAESEVQTQDHNSEILVALEEEISGKQNRLYMLQQVMEEEVRTGIAEMFHEAMLEHEKIIRNVMKIKKMTSRAQKEFQSQKNLEAHQKWIECSNKLMSEEYNLLKSEREIETIRYVFRMECGEE